MTGYLTAVFWLSVVEPLADAIQCSMEGNCNRQCVVTNMSNQMAGWAGNLMGWLTDLGQPDPTNAFDAGCMANSRCFLSMSVRVAVDKAHAPASRWLKLDTNWNEQPHHGGQNVQKQE